MDSLSQAVETALGATDSSADRPESPVGDDRRQQQAAAVKPKKRIDHHLWGTYLLLVMIALIELFSASVQEIRADDIFSPLIRHGRFIAAGLAVMLALQYIHYRFIFKFIPLYVIFSVGMMVAVRGGGEDINGAVRSITIMGTPVLPSEFMKLAVALGMAYILAKTQIRGKRDVSWLGLWICLGFLLGCAGLLFSQGLSNTIITVAIGMAMMFVGGMGWKKFGIAVGIVCILGLCGYKYKTTAEENTELSARQELVNKLNHAEMDTVGGSGRGKVWNKRVDNFYRPNKHLEKFSIDNQQEQLSYIAQAHGHIFGVGPGKSREAARLPLAYSDYVFAIIVEELGLIGGLFILLIYVWILGRSAKLTLQAYHARRVSYGLCLCDCVPSSLPHGNCVWRDTCIRPALAADFQGWHIGDCHIADLWRDAQCGKARRTRHRQQAGTTHRARPTARKRTKHQPGAARLIILNIKHRPSVIVRNVKPHKMKVLISGGGTGGHIFPALSIADAIKRRDPNAEILFVGAQDRMEMERVPAAGYEIVGLPVSGFDRKKLWRNVGVLIRLWKSIRLARKVVREFKPDIAIGVGGYASGPTLKAAQRAGVPTLLQSKILMPELQTNFSQPEPKPYVWHTLAWKNSSLPTKS